MSSRKKPVTKAMRLERRRRAEKAQEEYNKLSLQQKLDRLPKEGANRQRARLTALLEKQKEEASAPTKEKTKKEK